MGRRHIEGIGNKAAIQQKITTDDDEEHLKSLKKTFQRLEIHRFACIPPRDVHVTSSSPEQARHGVPGGVVQRRVVLVGFPIGGVGVQRLPELLVALVQLAG